MRRTACRTSKEDFDFALAHRLGRALTARIEHVTFDDDVLLVGERRRIVELHPITRLDRFSHNRLARRRAR